MTKAEFEAAQVVLNTLEQEHRDLLVNWSAIEVEAQAGDALIKLGAYLSTQLKTPQEKSHYLQRFEQDSYLATVFDRWKGQNNLDLAIWGTELGEKRKAALVEALLWRKFGSRILTNDASNQLQELLKLLLN